ncbi:MAG TPA: phosphate-starvation-inducible PsiE family protein [Ktedonobacteraceae bacterium]|nr:phosphate-starvation-inducible PsiE family protein [Ktedonobacteraceae bacterium]
MSNFVTDTTEPGHSHDAHPDHPIKIQHPKPHNPIAHYSAMFLENSDSFIYAIVGICFFLAGLFALGYSFWDFGTSMTTINDVIKAAAATHNDTTPQAIVASAIIKLVSDLLLVLIIMEVLGTVIHYLKSHATSLRPFLFIGIISATRGILSIGARLSVETVSLDEFNRSMIELGVNALAILALGITLKLLGKLVEDHQ